MPTTEREKVAHKESQKNIYIYIYNIYIYIYYANDMAMAATQRVLILGSWSGFCLIVSLKESGLE